MSKPAGSTPSPTVLVVDDNVTVTNALSRILKQEGYRTEVFNTGEDALHFVHHNPPAAAAVVDIHLPDLSGLVLSSKLRERFGPDRPIIVLSGDTSMENLRSLAHVGATYFISKPFKGEQLIERLREMGVGVARKR